MKMKHIGRISAIILTLAFLFGLCACGDDNRIASRDPRDAEEKRDENGYKLMEAEGCYYGTYTETDYNGEQKQGDRNYFMFRYDGNYYLVKAKEPADEAAIYREIGPEEYFKKKYGGTRLSIVGDSSTPDAFSSYYTEKSRINDEQYLLTSYELAYDDSKGVLLAKWETTNVFNGKEEPYESGSFKGNRK